MLVYIVTKDNLLAIVNGSQESNIKLTLILTETNSEKVYQYPI